METRQSSSLLWLGLAIVLAIGLMALFAAFFMPVGTGYGMMGGGWGVAFMAVPAVLLILVLLAALGLFTPSSTHATYPASIPPAPPVSSALDTLNARYARGEITRDEYLRMRSDLESHPH